MIFSASSSRSGFGFFTYSGGGTGSDSFSIYHDASFIKRVQTTQVFRDFSSWYHIVVSVDTTQATAANRIRIYVNGAEVTDFSTATYPAQNYQFGICQATAHAVGRDAFPSNYYFDGYLAETHLIDGSALDHTSFGKTDPFTGAWIPKQYSGSYGTNGFYLNVSDNSDVTATTLGKDSSGNGNNWTPVNFSVNDCGPDSPTNNFCTLNPLDRWQANNISTSEGNLEWANSSSGSFEMIRSTQAMQSGKWYAEYVVNSQGGTSRIFGGIVSVPNESLGGYLGQSTTEDSYGYAPNGTIYFNGSTTATGTTYTTGDVIGLALNLDDGEINFYKNNTYIAQKTGLSGYYAFGAHAYNTSDNGTFNFGQDSSFAGNKTTQGNSDSNGVGDFYYSPPAGYLALCTANLPVPTIKNGTEYMQTVLYTGNVTARDITVADNQGVAWQPDWVWIKGRPTTSVHSLYDSVRGATKFLRSHANNQETTDTDTLTSFNSNGFSLGADVKVNTNNDNYVSWNWKANGSGSANTDGDITSTVSVNADAGFSIVQFTPTASSGAFKIGHGLGVSPQVIIQKQTSSTGNWHTHHAQCAIPLVSICSLMTLGASARVLQMYSE